MGSDPEGAAARDALDPDVRDGLELAIANVRTVAEADLGADVEVTLPQGQTVTLRDAPVRRAAIYVPGGRAPYPSTVVMGVVTARVAGGGEGLVCAPGAHPPVLAPCAVSDDPALLDAIALDPGDAAAALVDAPDLEAALAFAEAFAPEHLELVGSDAEALAPRVRSAGCLFVGREGATAFGDYVA